MNITHVYELDVEPDIALKTPTEVLFRELTVENPDAVYVDQVLAVGYEDFEALGRPEHVTVTITAGDALR